MNEFLESPIVGENYVNRLGDGRTVCVFRSEFGVDLISAPTKGRLNLSVEEASALGVDLILLSARHWPIAPEIGHKNVGSQDSNGSIIGIRKQLHRLVEEESLLVLIRGIVASEA
jgi:hypothetical protein